MDNATPVTVDFARLRPLVKALMSLTKPVAVRDEHGPALRYSWTDLDLIVDHDTEWALRGLYFRALETDFVITGDNRVYSLDESGGEIEIHVVVGEELLSTLYSYLDWRAHALETLQM